MNSQAAACTASGRCALRVRSGGGVLACLDVQPDRQQIPEEEPPQGDSAELCTQRKSVDDPCKLDSSVRRSQLPTRGVDPLEFRRLKLNADVVLEADV